MDTPNPGRRETPPEVPHDVVFYPDDQALVGSLMTYLSPALRMDAFVGGPKPGSALLLITAGHWRLLERAMQDAGIDVGDRLASQRLVVLDSDDTLARISGDDGSVDAEALRELAMPIIREQYERHGRVRLFGEMVATLWSRSYVGAALELEDVWNELAREGTFSLFCAYPQQLGVDAHGKPSGGGTGPHSDAWRKLLLLHTGVTD